MSKKILELILASKFSGHGILINSTESSSEWMNGLLNYLKLKEKKQKIIILKQAL